MNLVAFARTSFSILSFVSSVVPAISAPKAKDLSDQEGQELKQRLQHFYATPMDLAALNGEIPHSASRSSLSPAERR